MSPVASEHLEQQTFESLLSTKIIGKSRGWKNEIWETIDSTNSRAIELAGLGAPEGVVVAARQQTAGRGRLGRVWISPPDSGLYISLLLRPQLPVAQVPLMSLAAGAAVARTLELTCGFRPGLKWVNDIVYGGKKLGGILAEMPSLGRNGGGSSTAALIVGIGINRRFQRDELPEELQNSATWIEAITGSPADANVIAAALCADIERLYTLLGAGETTQIVSEWTAYSATLGKRIKAVSAGNNWEGTAVRIAADGALILRADDGEETALHAGEVTIRNLDGSYS